jgi:Tfp pilus assembly protein PilF
MSYDKATGIDPDYEDAWFNKGLAYQELGKEDKAQYCFNIADSLKNDRN